MLGTARTIFIDALFVHAGMIVLIVAALVFAWWQRSIVVATVACVLILMAGLWFEPWLAFDPSFYANPREMQWIVWRRVVSVIWGLLVFTGLASLIALIQLRRL